MLDINQIRDLLPHRYPFLFVDRVVELGADRAVGYKNVSANEPFFQGHFPEYPIMPGVLIAEALAQMGAILIMSRLPNPKEKLVLFAAIDNCKFRRPVVPGDRLEIHVRKLKKRGNIWRFACEAMVEGAKVAEAEISAMLMPAGQS